MGNCLYIGAEGTHKTEILQSPSTKDEAKAADGYSGAQHVRQEEVIRQQPTARTTKATSYRLFDPCHDRKSEAPATTHRTASYKNSAYNAKPDITLSCPKDLRVKTERQLTEYEKDVTLLPSATVDLTKASTEEVAVSSSENSKKRPLCFINDAFKNFNDLSTTTHRNL